MNNEITINIEEILKLPDGSVTDAETIRQIGLATTKYNFLTKEQSSALGKKIQPGLEFGALYPHIVEPLDIEMDDETKDILDKIIRNSLYFDLEDKEFDKMNLIIYGNLGEVYGQSFAKNWVKEKYDVEVDYTFIDDKGSKYLNIGLVITGLKDVKKAFEIKEDKKIVSDLDDLLGDIKPLF